MKRFSSQTIQKILVPTDGSEHSIHAAEYAVSIAQVHEAEIRVVYVIDEDVISKFSGTKEREAVARELEMDGQRHTKYILGLAEKANVKAASLIAKGRPFKQIVTLAKSLEMDLIVMGTYGYMGAERILIGSVAERVIGYSPCPVLVVK